MSDKYDTMAAKVWLDDDLRDYMFNYYDACRHMDDVRSNRNEAHILTRLAALLREREGVKTCPHCHCQYVIHTNETTELYECACGATADKKAHPALPQNWQEAIRGAAEWLPEVVCFREDLWDYHRSHAKGQKALAVDEIVQTVTRFLSPVVGEVRDRIENIADYDTADIDRPGDDSESVRLERAESAVCEMIDISRTALRLLGEEE